MFTRFLNLFFMASRSNNNEKFSSVAVIGSAADSSNALIKALAVFLSFIEKSVKMLSVDMIFPFA